MPVIEILRLLQAAVLVGLAILAVIHWRRQGGPAGWLAASFGAISVAVVLGRIDLPEGLAGLLTQKVQVTLLALFPYFLFLFQRAFTTRGRFMPVVATLVTGGIIAWTLALPVAVTVEADAPLYVRGVVMLLVGQWAVLSGYVAMRLWQGGRGQPPGVRARMRALGVGALVLTLALLVGAFAPPWGATPYVTVLLAIAAGLVFYLSFVPPGFVRAAWRQRTASRLWDVERELAHTTAPAEVADVLLPVVRETLGAEAAVLTDADGAIIASNGVPPAAAAQMLESDAFRGIVAPLESGSLVTIQGHLAPYYGRDEEDLVRSFGTVTELALHRAALFAQERELRREAEATRDELEALVYGLSHDLKSPLITVLGYLDLLRSDYETKLDDQGRQFLDRLQSNVTYMEALLTDLLELSRIGRVQTEPAAVDLRAIAEEVAAEISTAHPEAAIEVGDLPAGWINPVRARQLIRNLVDNAVIHGGRDDVTVRVEAEPGERGMVRFVVADDGVGIPPEHSERVFAIFERLGERSGTAANTGIGLAMCRRIVEAAGGSVVVRDEEGPGTTVEVALPAPPRQLRAVERAHEQKQEATS
jgi:signal transduction histidine kinase